MIQVSTEQQVVKLMNCKVSKIIVTSAIINSCSFHYLQHPHNLPVVYQLPYCPVVVYPSVGCLYQMLMDTLCITMEERLY